MQLLKQKATLIQTQNHGSDAKGLMQLMENTAMELSNRIDDRDIKVEELYNPETNIKLGTNYFSTLLKQYRKYRNCFGCL